MYVLFNAFVSYVVVSPLQSTILRSLSFSRKWQLASWSCEIILYAIDTHPSAALPYRIVKEETYRYSEEMLDGI